MALNGKAQGNGWLDQAARLAVTHATPIATRAQASAAAADTEFAAATDDRETVLAEELELTRARATGLERRLAQETAAKQTLSEQFQAAEARIAELESELAATSDDLALRDNENQSLRTSLDLAMAENAALTERLAKSDAAQRSSGSQLEFLQTALATAETECTRLFNEARDFRIEASTLNDVLARMTSRAEVAERLLTDARQCLAARIAENAVTERSLADATAARRDTAGELHQLQDLLRLKQCQINELEQSRLQLIAATNTLLKTFQNRDAALVHADDEIRVLNGRIVQLEAQIAQLEAQNTQLEARNTQREAQARQAASRRETAKAAAQSQQTVVLPGADDGGEKIRKKWAELARELAKLAKLKPQLLTPIQGGSSLLASTITF
jgi:chromosome segregation ATPase